MKPEFQHAPDYLCLMKGGTYHRLFVLKQMAHRSGKTWRECRQYGFNDWAAAHAHFSAGENNGERVWYTHTGEYFRDERFVNQCEGGPDHRGWYTRHDSETSKDGSGLARGIVARLPHGRFIAGYWWGDNGERVWFNEVYTDESDAARSADSHAEEWAEICREDSEKWDAARECEEQRDEALERLRECIALRNKTGFSRVRAEIPGLIETIKTCRARLDDEFKNYI